MASYPLGYDAIFICISYYIDLKVKFNWKITYLFQCQLHQLDCRFSFLGSR